MDAARLAHRTLLREWACEAERSPEFAALWARQDVGGRPEGWKRLDHPDLGCLDLEYTTYRVNDEPGLKLVLYVPEAGSATNRVLRGQAASAPGTER